MDVELLNHQLLRELTAIESDPVVSLYLPTTANDGDAQRPAIHLKNLLRDAEQRLIAADRPEEATARWLKPIADLEDDPAAWRRINESLAVFRWRGQLRVIRLPFSVSPRVHVGKRADVLPLLDPRATGGRFALLVLSLNRVRLMECSRYAAIRLHHDELPESYEASLGKYVDAERQLQYHSGAASHAGGAQSRPAVYHGQGNAGDDSVTQPRRIEFCRTVDRAVRDRLHGSDLPLVLAADVSAAATYRQVNRYHPLLDDTVTGSFDHLDDAALRDKAMPLIERNLEQSVLQSVLRYRETPPDGRTEGAHDTLQAAHEARIDLLLVRKGDYDEQSNLIACLALNTGANALALDPDRMPAPQPVCGVLRF